MKTSGPWYKRTMRKLRIEQTLKVCNGATTFCSLSTAQNIRSWRLKMYTELNAGAILREASYTEGYKAGKKAAAKEFFEDLCQLGACSQGVVLNIWDLQELKEKWGIK
jgi:hypothetical protein